MQTTYTLSKEANLLTFDELMTFLLEDGNQYSQATLSRVISLADVESDIAGKAQKSVLFWGWAYPEKRIKAAHDVKRVFLVGRCAFQENKIIWSRKQMSFIYWAHFAYKHSFFYKKDFRSTVIKNYIEAYCNLEAAEHVEIGEKEHLDD